MLELLWLLLPVAAASGWYAGRGDRARSAQRRAARLPGQYFQGLNYLLNEQPDKAIEVFTELADLDSDAVETHLALASLFRRRGELDRATRIHQNLIARPSLTPEQRAYALFELAEDYLRAGLLDRAEYLFEEVVEKKAHAERALRQLLAIYQQEREWDKAIDAALRLEKLDAAGMRPLVAQFLCEQAEALYRERDFSGAQQLVKRALGNDARCVRASMLLAAIERAQGQLKAAVKTYQRIEHQDAAFLPEVLGSIRECYRALDQSRALAAYLRACLDKPVVADQATAMLTEMIEQKEGTEAAAAFLADRLRSRPCVSGLDKLLEIELKVAQGRRRRDLEILRELISGMVREHPIYECGQCGFSGRSLHWQCPSCKSWATVKPINDSRGSKIDVSVHCRPTDPGRAGLSSAL